MALRALSFLFVLILLSQVSFSQKNTNTKVFEFVEVMPEFDGGESALNSYLRQHLKFPLSVMKDSSFSEEVVYIDFIVDRQGAVTKAKITKGDCIPCVYEALRVVSAMPKWKAGTLNGAAVEVQYTLPIRFRKKE